MNIRRLLPIGFGSVVLVIIVQNIIFQLTAQRLQKTTELVSHSYEVQYLIKELEKTVVDAETGQRGFIYTGQESFLEPYNDALSNIAGDIDKLKDQISDNPEQVQRVNETQKLIQDKLDELQETIDLKKEGKEKELRELVLSGRGKEIMDEIRAKLVEMDKVEDQLLEKRKKESDQAYTFVLIVTWVSLITVVSISLIVLVIINNIAIQPIQQIVSTLSSSANEMATSIEQQQRTSSLQASSVNETTSTIEELGASSQQSSQQAEQADFAAQQALKVAGMGSDIVTETLNGMIDLKKQVEDISTQITRLSEETNQIGSISGLVSDIANQTNMLALNASVEAVRAGENGKGFGVVAGEIRKLADQTKQSAEKINSLVSTVQNLLNNTVMVTDEGTKKVNTGMEITQKTTKAFQEIIDAMNNVVLNNKQISLNVKQQSHAIVQIVQTMDNINKGSQETVNAIGQTQAVANQLNKVSSQLTNII